LSTRSSTLSSIRVFGRVPYRVLEYSVK